MAKRRTATSRRSTLDPDDVLAGRVAPRAEALVELIRRVNPTDRELDARDAQRRYALKSRLQSLLVRRFPGELVVVAEPGREDLVSIRCQGQDACHALVSTLDDDARSWVRLQLDLSQHEPATPPGMPPQGRKLAPAPEPAASEATPDDLVRRAQQALEAFDYEQARADLAHAVAASGGAPGPVSALLEVLVDLLGDDAEALASSVSWPRATLADARVRLLLALAEARSGDRRRALELAEGADHPRSAEVFAVLASAAMKSGEIEEASAHLARARQRDPASPALASLSDEIARARAAARAPVEAELLRLAESGQDEEAARRAAEVLATWPESETARRTLRKLEERRRVRLAQRLVAEGEERLSGGDVAAAVSLLRRAFIETPPGAERAALGQRIERAEAAERERHVTASVERVCGLLGASDPAAGLAAYLSLDEARRARVRAQSTLAALGWLELARGADRARVEGVLALSQAGALAAQDPDAAVALLEQHESVLERIPEARRFRQDALARAREVRILRAREDLRAARAAFEGGDAGEALRRLADVPVRDLPDEERAQVTELRAQAGQADERERRVADLARHRAAGRLFEARAAVDELAALASGDERARWACERDALTAQIQRAFRVEVDDTPQPVEALGRYDTSYARNDASAWLCDGGREIALVEAHDGWIFVRIVDCALTQVTATVVLRTPEPFGHTDAEVCGATLWVLGARGAVLEIAMDRWEISSFHAAAERGLTNEVVESTLLAPGAPSFLWVVTRARGFSYNARVVDLEHRRTVREISDVPRVALLAHPEEPRVACFKDRALAVCNTRGTVVPNGKITLSAPAMGTVAHPLGRGLVVLTTEDVLPMTEDVQDPEAVTPLAWVEITPEGEVLAQHRLEGTDSDACAVIAASRDAGMIFISSMTSDGDQEIWALRAEGDALTLAYRTKVSSGTLLLQDSAARRVVALFLHPGGADAAELGPAPPALPLRPESARVRIPGASDVYFCAPRTREDEGASQVRRAALRLKSPVELARWIREQQKTHADRPEHLVDLVHTLRVTGMFGYQEADRLGASLWAAHPTHPDVRMLHADKLAHEARWAEVREALTGIDSAAFDEAKAQHMHHLLAMASLFTGHLGDAREALAAALDIGGGACELDVLVDVLAPPPSPAAASSGGGSVEGMPLFQVVAAVRQADGCLVAGDVEGALRALGRDAVWMANEVQSLARWAEAHLRSEPASRPERFRARMVLARFCEAQNEKRPSCRRELPIPGAMWDTERLDDVAARARRWLDEGG